MIWQRATVSWVGGNSPVWAGRRLSEGLTSLCCWGDSWPLWRAAWRWRLSAWQATMCSGQVCPKSKQHHRSLGHVSFVLNIHLNFPLNYYFFLNDTYLLCEEVSSMFASPCSGCCCHTAVSDGSCSVCSWASSPYGSRRSWGPSGYQGNVPAGACFETSSQMDWQVGRGEKQYHCYYLTKKGIKHSETKTQDQNKHTPDKTQTRTTTCNKSEANRSSAHSNWQWL